MIVVGIDPGFARMGVAVLEGSFSTPEITTLDLWETEPEKDAVSKADDHSRRLAFYAQRVEDLMQRWPDAVAIEVQQLPVGRIQISTVMNLGRVRGIFDALTARGVPVMDQQPTNVKKWITADRFASKEAIEAALIARHPMLTQALQKWPKSKREHLTDAVAVATVAWMKLQNPNREG
mgnify:CR=1 FL=1